MLHKVIKWIMTIPAKMKMMTMMEHIVTGSERYIEKTRFMHTILLEKYYICKRKM